MMSHTYAHMTKTSTQIFQSEGCVRVVHFARRSVLIISDSHKEEYAVS